MCGREWFIVGARLFGLWVLYNGVSHASVLVEHMMGIEQPDRGTYAPGTYLLHASWHLVFAGILLLKTRSLVHVVYGEADSTVGSEGPGPTA
jgi:hypothetical protein